jgi:DNA-binding IclR family transcriptional regulator
MTITMNEKETKPRNRISGIERSLQILDVLTDFARPASAYDIAKTIGAPISTIYSIVEDLVARQMLTKDSNNLVWLGPRLLRYGLAYEAKMDILLEARKEMDHRAAHLKETIQICTLDEGKMVVTAMATGNEHFHVASHIGSRTPINWTASGRLLVGHMEENECLEMFRKYSETSPNSNTIIDPVELSKTSKEEFTAGLAIQVSLSEFSVSCIAAPIKGRDGSCIATISVVLPEQKASSNIEYFTTEVQNSANKIELAIGSF